MCVFVFMCVRTRAFCECRVCVRSVMKSVNYYARVRVSTSC